MFSTTIAIGSFGSIDFFKNDPPESLAQKLVCVNLSDLSSMGSVPVAYTLNLSINSKVNINWLKRFTNRLFKSKKNNLSSKYCWML